jgi:putative SOS response-associated peptidase YedK
MCGRFTLALSAEAIAQAFALPSPPRLEPRFNIAPTQPAPVIVAAGTVPFPKDVEIPDGEGDRQFTYLYWGLIPSWSKDPTIGARMINARAETVQEKPSFRTAFKKRRCLVVADGFYEWKGTGKSKQPYFFYVGNSGEQRHPFAFAGLWEHWRSPEGDTVNSCTILTTEANNVLRPVHDRMPVILHPENYDQWLDPDFQKPEPLQSLLRPYDTDPMGSHAVSTIVNSPKNDTPQCITPTP